MKNNIHIGIILTVLMITVIGLSNATLMTTGTVQTKEVTFASNIHFAHSFLFYDVVSDQYVTVTDADIMRANAHTFETNGIPLVSSPISGKVYVLPQEFTVSDDWLVCIELGGMAAVEPLGGGLELPSGGGNKFYSTGANGPFGDGLDRYEYMDQTGWDPVVLWRLMHGA